MSNKILFILESFFPTHRAGTEIYVLNLCRFFTDKGWKVGVLISTTSETDDYEYEGIPVYTFKVPLTPIAKELNGIIPPRGIDTFIKRVKELDPVLVHFHSFGRSINGYHLQAAKELGIHTVFTPHLGGFFCIKGDLRLYGKVNCDGQIIETRCLSCLLQNKGIPFPVSLIIGKIIYRVTKITFLKKILPSALYQAKHRKCELNKVYQYSDIAYSIAPWIKRAFEGNGIDNSVLLPQGISPLFLKSRGGTKPGTKEKVDFVFIGRMHPSKGFHLLQQAWNDLDTTKCNLHILTNPSGGEITYFHKQKEWALAHPNVKWIEGSSQAEVADYLPRMDVLILPSISNEVAPLVILEAAAFGIPTIGSDYIAIKDMIQHRINGLIFKSGDYKDLQHQIESMVHHPALINTLRANTKPPVSINTVAETIEKDYIELLRADRLS